MLSNNPDFKNLLLLHSRDRRKLAMDQELENLPHAIAHMESKIQIEKDTIAAATAELKSLESQNNSIEDEINSISEHVSRQKNKQLQVKKNEEYQALENEIAILVQQLSGKEDEQIETLLKIDGAKETTEIAQNKISAKVDVLELEKIELLGKCDLLKQDILKLDSEIKESRKEVEEILLLGYERTKKVVARLHTLPLWKIKNALDVIFAYQTMYHLLYSWNKNLHIVINAVELSISSVN